MVLHEGQPTKRIVIARQLLRRDVLVSPALELERGMPLRFEKVHIRRAPLDGRS
jgi:hypothetical protein